MVNIQLIEKIRKFSCASFALWSDDFGTINFKNSIEYKVKNEKESSYLLIDFFKKNNVTLKTDVILLALNQSGKDPREENLTNSLENKLDNFHNVPHQGDKRLKQFIQENKLINIIGCYMTDINMHTKDSNSKNVKCSENDISEFIEQMELFGKNTFKVICFGDKSFDGLYNYRSSTILKPKKKVSYNIKYASIIINKIELNIYRVWHYSNQRIPGKYQELKKQLLFVNENI